MIEFNLLVTYVHDFLGARQEIVRVLSLIGDNSATVRRTLIRGIIGVLSSLDSHRLASSLQEISQKEPNRFWFTQRWIPIDLWTASDIPSMKEGVRKIAKIGEHEQWMMVVEKRRHETIPTSEIIRELAEVVEGRVDLRKPEKIVRVDILGPFAGISLLSPGEIFSTVRRGTPPQTRPTLVRDL